MSRLESDPASLPDLLRPGLDVVFVGINPSIYSVQQGHYFACRANRFFLPGRRFRARFSFCRARQTLGVERESRRREHDLVSCPIIWLRLHRCGAPVTNGDDALPACLPACSCLRVPNFAAGVASLVEKLESFAPRFACFHGIMAFRPLYRACALDRDEGRAVPRPARSALSNSERRGSCARSEPGQCAFHTGRSNAIL